MEKALWTVEEVSTYLSVKPSTIYQWAKDGGIPHFRLGKVLRFKKAEIDTWIENCRAKPIDPAKKGREIFKGVKNPKMDIDRIVQKSIESVKNSGYNRGHGKPDRVKGLGKEVKDGTL
jgi:excisionase family DNA binding protein